MSKDKQDGKQKYGPVCMSRVVGEELGIMVDICRRGICIARNGTQCPMMDDICITPSCRDYS